MREPSNLPPGVRESDIPGNRSEDAAWDVLYDTLPCYGLKPEEIRVALLYFGSLPERWRAILLETCRGFWAEFDRAGKRAPR